MSQLKWYFEDFEAGKTIDVGSRTVSEEEIIDFATKFDPQPFHVDKAAASALGTLQLVVILSTQSAASGYDRKLYAFNNCAVAGDNTI